MLVYIQIKTQRLQLLYRLQAKFYKLENNTRTHDQQGCHFPALIVFVCIFEFYGWVCLSGREMGAIDTTRLLDT